ncbi:transposase [Senegalimassilia anaerobia]
MGNPSPRYTAEFKQKAVELCGKSGTTYAEVARGLGCDAGSLADWVKKADAAGPAPDANPFQMAEDLRRLKRENERLKREDEILLKASAFFASRQL